MNNASNSEVKEFYDDFVVSQTKLGISVRHRLIFQAVKKLDLPKSSNVLEIGCGVGTVSKLLAAHFSAGHFLGCDISEKSIAYAKQFVVRERAHFLCSDMSDFQSDIKFDLVVFPDVLEHIPQENHRTIFHNIARACGSNATWFIHIPSPESIAYHREHYPHLLQIIDQSLDLSQLISDAKSCGFEVEALEKYSIHTNANNYVKLIFKNKTKLDSIKLNSKIHMGIQNILARL